MGPVEVTLLALVVAYVLCLVVSAQNGQWLWFVLGLFIAPFALVGALVAPKPDSHNGRKRMRTCPKCAEYVKKEASVCRYCGTELEPVQPFRLPGFEEPPVTEVPRSQDSPRIH